jgi:transcriptional regulator with XRE-family HTH domain
MFRILRADIGATQVSLAGYFNRSRATVNRWERNLSPIPDEVLIELRKIRKTLPTDPAEVWAWSGITQTQPDLEERPGVVERIDPTLTGDEIGRLEFVLGELFRLIDEIKSDNQADRNGIADVRAQLETISAQLHSPHPSRHVVAATLQILVAVIGTVAALATLWDLYGQDLQRLLSRLRQ